MNYGQHSRIVNRPQLNLNELQSINWIISTQIKSNGKIMSKIKSVYGIHAVSAVLDAAPQRIVKLYVKENRDDRRLQSLVKKAKGLGVKVILLSRTELNTLSNEKHQGIVAEFEEVKNLDESTFLSLLKKRETPAVLLILDGVKDPHNLGACLRSANAFGVLAIIAPKDRAVGITPVVRKVACGEAEMTPFIRVTNLSRTIDRLQKEGVWIVGTAVEAETLIQEIDLTGDIAIVLGSEGAGLRRLTKERCDFLAKIPLCRSVESLNVSVACGICLYEVQRQREASSSSLN